MRRAINEPIKQQLMKAATSNKPATLSPLSKLCGPVTKLIRGYSWPRRPTEGSTSSCGGGGNESVLGDGGCKSGDRANVSSAVEDVSWHAGEKFSTLLWGGWFEAMSEAISSLVTGHLRKGAKSEVETVLSCPSLKRIIEYVWLPSTSSKGSRKGSCCEHGGANVQVQGAVAMKGVQNQSWLCWKTVRSVHEEFNLWKGKQGIGQLEGLLVT